MAWRCSCWTLSSLQFSPCNAYFSLRYTTVRHKHTTLMHLHNFNSKRQCLMKGGENSCGWETTYHLYNVLMSGSDAGSLSKGVAIVMVVQCWESWPHKPGSKPHRSTEMPCVMLVLRSGMRVTSRSKSATSPQSLAGSQHRRQQGIYV